MKTLIIAEKPKQAKIYADVLGGFSKKDGYYESDTYYLTYCFGHMVELADDTAYHNYEKWSLDYLPLIPQHFQYNIGKSINKNRQRVEDGSKKAQLNTIDFLAKKSNFIINATDADREGELIFLYVYNYLGLKLPFKRHWASDPTPNSIRKAFENLLEPSVSLGQAAYLRAQADWLIGINATQAASLILGSGKPLHIGRVKTAILKIICDRYEQFKNHKKIVSFKIIAQHKVNEIAFTSETTPFDSLENANKTLAGLNIHKVTSFKEEETSTPTPLLYSINTLSIDCNKIFKFTAQKTLDIAQSLYENHSLISYPRTDTEYINKDNYLNLQSFTAEFAQNYLDTPFTFHNDMPRCVNETKLVGSHDAIVLTGIQPNLERLSKDENLVFKLILSRMLQAFHKEMKYIKKSASFLNNEIEFKAHSSRLIDQGWSVYKLKDQVKEDREEESEEQIAQDLPFFSPNEPVPVLKFNTKEVISKPKPLYTEGSLITDLTNMGKFLSQENKNEFAEILKDCQIGTEATRAGIIAQLLSSNYIVTEKNKLLPTAFGLSFYQTIHDLKICDLATTAIFEKKLKSVEKGEYPDTAFLKEIQLYTEDIYNDIIKKNGTDSKILAPSLGSSTTIGSCPNCKANNRQGHMVKGKFNYGCSNWKDSDTPGCKFKIPFSIADKKLSDKVVADLLEKGITATIKGFTSKAQKPFDAKLQLVSNEETKMLEVKFLFDNPKK